VFSFFTDNIGRAIGTEHKINTGDAVSIPFDSAHIVFPQQKEI
jgi:hypothetical protein